MFVLPPCILGLFCKDDEGRGKKKEKSQASVCQLGPKMEDLVDSPLSVIISCTESHKNAAGLTEKKGAS